MTTIRQKCWIAMSILLALPVEGCYWCGFSAGLSDPQQPTRGQPKDNHSSAIPGAAIRGRRIAERLRRPARDLDLLEMVTGEEADVAAVRRPEGQPRALRAGERLGLA